MKNMLRYIRICTALAVLLGATACLEKYPAQSIPEKEAMQNYNDAEQHLVGIYSSLKSGALYTGYLTLLPDIQSDLVYAVEGNSNTYGDYWQWTVRSTASEILSVYGSLYTVIGDCNFFLDRIDAVKAAETDDEKLDVLDAYTGEVYAIRALCYSELLKCFCKAYDPATADQEPGVVLRTKYFEKEPVRRATLRDSYDFVLQNLAKAEELLSDEDSENAANAVFFTLAAAEALHARVALYMQDWETAIEYSSKLIDERSHLFELADAKTAITSDGLTWFDYMWFYDQSPEVIFRVGLLSTDSTGALGSVFLSFNRDYTYFYPDFVPAQWVLNAYDNTIAYTDHFLHTLITELRRDNATAAMLYTSDHGENIFDDERALFLHASPRPSAYELHVPLLIWLSESYRERHPDTASHLECNTTRMVQTSASVFHTMLDIAGISTPLLADSLSMASPRFTPTPYRYLTDRNEAVRWELNEK